VLSLAATEQRGRARTTKRTALSNAVSRNQHSQQSQATSPLHSLLQQHQHLQQPHLHLSICSTACSPSFPAGIISSRIVLGLLKPMLYVASISLLVCTYHSLVDAAILQQLAPWVRIMRCSCVACAVELRALCSASALWPLSRS
jgi:hypothetical protein